MMSLCYSCFREYDGDVCPYCGYAENSDRGKYPLALPHGTILGGRYITGRVLGQGGFGITYVAQDYTDKKLVAVKEFFPEQLAMRSGSTVSTFSGEREDAYRYGKECFLSEAKTLAEFIGNPNIVRVYSYFEENGTVYFSMEYIEGVSLLEYIRSRGGSIPYEEAKKLLLPVMDALSSVHAKGIIHRDISPDNIFITRDGTVKLIDFGAARYSMGDRSRSLDVVLKHGYAPKEQYTRHGRQGPYTDVYSLAATFYRCVAGRIPPDSIDRLDDDSIILPSSLGSDIPAFAEDALLTALAVNPADRFQSMKLFQSALKSGVESAPELSPESHSSTGYHAHAVQVDSDLPHNQPLPSDAPEKKSRSRIVVGFSVVAAVIAVVVMIVLLLPKGSSSDTSASVKENPSSSYENNDTHDSEQRTSDIPSQSATEAITEAVTEAITEAPTQAPTDPPSDNREFFAQFSIEVSDGIIYSVRSEYDTVAFYDEYNYYMTKSKYHYEGGWLASIRAFSSRSAAEEYYKKGFKCKMLDYNNGYYFVVEYPTDVQWDTSDKNAEFNYRKNQTVFEDMLETIE